VLLRVVARFSAHADPITLTVNRKDTTNKSEAVKRYKRHTVQHKPFGQIITEWASQGTGLCSKLNQNKRFSHESSLFQ
jgi:hypothetical protein